MSLCFEASKWTKLMWDDHARTSPSARRLLRDGQAKQPTWPGFLQSLHDMIYLRREPPVKTNPIPPEWASHLLSEAKALPQFMQLKRRCAANGFLSGISTETLAREILPLLPDTPPPDPSQSPGSSGSPQAGDDVNAPDPAQEQALRKALRQACAAASSAVDEAEASLDAMGDALGISAGKGLGAQETMQDLTQVRELFALLSKNDLLKKIAQMAGRLKRLGEAHKKTRVSPAPGGITDVILGGDLALVLPAELAGLRSKSRLLKLMTLHKIVARQALQYLTSGVESETRGPIVMCLDESGSMAYQGADVWSKAVAMSLLTIAMQQKRAAHILGFTEGITHEDTILPGGLTLEIIAHALLQKCDGGTRFDVPLERSLDVLATFPGMKRSDVILLTDGEAPIDEELIAKILKVKKETGLHIFVIGIGATARRKIHVFDPIADAIYLVAASPDQDSDVIAPLLAAIAR